MRTTTLLHVRSHGEGVVCTWSLREVCTGHTETSSSALHLSEIFCQIVGTPLFGFSGSVIQRGPTRNGIITATSSASSWSSRHQLDAVSQTTYLLSKARYRFNSEIGPSGTSCSRA